MLGRRVLIGLVGGATMLIFGIVQPARALTPNPVTIAPQGGVSTISVQNLAWNDGNSLAQGGEQAVRNFLTNAATGSTLPTTFDTYFQARLSVFNEVGGGTVAPTPSGYQWTVVLGVTETVTTALGSPPFPAGQGFAAFGLAAVPTVNFLNIYYNGATTANDLAGTGFVTGSPILTATVADLTSNFTVTNGTPTTFDAIHPANWPGQNTVTGFGGATVVADVNTYNTAFFKEAPGAIILTFFNDVGLQDPYNQVDPSRLFNDTSGPVFVPSIGPVNGDISGTAPDVMFQTTGTESFTVIPKVPEPATAGLGLLGLGALALAALRRRHA